MPVEFALRPRIRLREAPAPSRRARARLPKFALPALAYWLVIGGLVYEFVQRHEPSALRSESDALSALPAAPPPVARQWWRPLPSPPADDAPHIGTPPRAEPPIDQPEPVQPTPELPVAELPALAAPTDERPVASDSSFDPELPFAARRGEPKREPTPSRPRATADRTASPHPTDGDPIAALSFPALDGAPKATAPDSAPARPSLPSPTSDSVRSAVTSGLPTCESAIASASQEVDFSGGNRAADLPSQAIAAVLENGAWLASCNVPEHTALEICVAIRGGRVVGASVSARPADAAISGCVRRRAASLQFPYSPHLDVARTRF